VIGLRPGASLLERYREHLRACREIHRLPADWPFAVLFVTEERAGFLSFHGYGVVLHPNDDQHIARASWRAEERPGRYGPTSDRRVAVLCALAAR